MAESSLPSPADCIVFSTADWRERYWTNKQHCASQLAQLGWRVLYVESVGLRSPKISSKRDWSRLWRRLGHGLVSFFRGAQLAAPNIWVMSPLLVPAAHDHALLGRMNRWLLQSALRRFLRKHEFKRPLVWTYHPFMLDAIAQISRSKLLYHCVDDIGEVPGVDAEAYRVAEIKLLEQSDVVFATAMSLKDRCARHNPNTHYLSNVVDDAHFGKALVAGELPADLATIPEPRLGYHGVLSDFKLDFGMLIECAQQRPDWHWVFIGEEREGQQSADLTSLRRLPNVHFLGYRPYEVLPSYLRGMAVGLLPSRLNAYTRSMFPMKYYEYLAAGLPVVATSLAFTEQASAGIEIGDSSGAFVEAIARQLARGRLTPGEARACVGNNTWRQRTLKMLSCLAAVDCDRRPPRG